jgi:hypothetical protein
MYIYKLLLDLSVVQNILQVKSLISNSFIEFDIAVRPSSSSPWTHFFFKYSPINSSRWGIPLAVHFNLAVAM